MAADPSGGLRRSVAAQADKTGKQVVAAYDRLVTEVSPETMRAFLAEALPLLQAGVSTAHALTASAYRKQRRAAPEAKSRLTVPAAGKFNKEQARSSLVYTGFAAPAKRETGVASFEVPLVDHEPDKTREMVRASAGRRVVQQSMDTMQAAVRADRDAIGWARVAAMDNKTCYFCSMLASRGAVYKRDSFEDSDSHFRSNAFPQQVMTGELVAKVHDFCRCVLVPIWSKKSAVVTHADDLYKTWLRVQNEYGGIAGMAGWDMMQVWRLFWEGRIDKEVSAYLARN